MPVFNYAKKEVNLKIVYYGPGLSGKTTNLQSIHDGIKPGSKGKLVSLATQTDRTLFFDFMPMELGSFGGFRIRLHLYTVPGQVHYNATRKLVLKGVDGVVFVADSQRPMAEANLESFSNLEKNLRSYGKALEEIPHLIQANKRDLANILSMEEVASMLNRHDAPLTEAVASDGTGVIETLSEIVRMVMRGLREQLYTPQNERASGEKVPEKEVAPLIQESEPEPEAELKPESEPEGEAEPEEEPELVSQLLPDRELATFEEPESVLDAEAKQEDNGEPDTLHGTDSEVRPGFGRGSEDIIEDGASEAEASGVFTGAAVPGEDRGFSGPIRITVDVEGVGPVELTLTVEARVLRDIEKNTVTNSPEEGPSGKEGMANSLEPEPVKPNVVKELFREDERVASGGKSGLKEDPEAGYVPPGKPVDLFHRGEPGSEKSEPRKKGLMDKFFGKK